ncbi:MAG: metal-dependent hydrolase [Cruoricaptor ignavus]|nr:metal-dependent hydrolase [Cruoricaptor ignavus]
MKIKFLGQNCFLFYYKGKTILTDPFYNYQKEKTSFRITNQKVDYVLITHAHGDHTADVKEILQLYPDATIIAQPEICGYFAHPNSIDLNFGGTTNVEDLQITMVTASHTSSFPDGTYGGQPAGYILKTEEKTIYLAGDTGIISDMALFPKLFGKIDWAILPLGGHYTMDVEMALFAATELLKTERVIGCHFDTFPPIEIDTVKTLRAFDEKNIDLILPLVGDEYIL